jgi:hypothetical protein
VGQECSEERGPVSRVAGVEELDGVSGSPTTVALD